MTANRKEVAVIGDRNTILGFEVFGIDTFEASSADEAQRHLQETGGYNTVFLTENFAAGDLPPNVTIIPGQEGSSSQWKSSVPLLFRSNRMKWFVASGSLIFS